MELVEIMEETWDALLLRAEEKLGNTEAGLQQYLIGMAAYEDSVSEEFLQYLYQLRNYYEKQKKRVVYPSSEGYLRGIKKFGNYSIRV